MPLTSDAVLSSSLKSYTGSPHASLEKLLIGKLRKISSNNDYARILELMYGYYHPIESRIETQLGERKFSRKAEWIIDDLHILGNGFHTPQICTDVPQITNTAQAFGALYVLEGSTLGGVHIAGIIAKKLTFPNPAPLRFFEGYGTETKQHWETFCTVLNEKQFTETEKDQVRTTAARTFMLFEKWIRENEPGTAQ
ncbi:MAG: biliverdin-producing heme oxygenase [Chitinophagaceae bacterium]